MKKIIVLFFVISIVGILHPTNKKKERLHSSSMVLPIQIDEQPVKAEELKPKATLVKPKPGVPSKASDGDNSFVATVVPAEFVSQATQIEREMKKLAAQSMAKAMEILVAGPPASPAAVQEIKQAMESISAMIQTPAVNKELQNTISVLQESLKTALEKAKPEIEQILSAVQKLIKSVPADQQDGIKNSIEKVFKGALKLHCIL